MTTCLNDALFDDLFRQLWATPERWNQDFYRCGAVMCAAGWTVALTGGRWIGTTDALSPEVDDAPEDVICGEIEVTPGKEMTVQYVVAFVRAKRLLGLTDGEADALFSYFTTSLEALHVRYNWLRTERGLAPVVPVWERDAAEAATRAA